VPKNGVECMNRLLDDVKKRTEKRKEVEIQKKIENELKETDAVTFQPVVNHSKKYQKPKRTVEQFIKEQEDFLKIHEHKIVSPNIKGKIFFTKIF
jgi:hypothetical protein